MGRYRKLGALFNRTFRNDYNANVDDMERDIDKFLANSTDAKGVATSAETKAYSAISTANQAVTKAESVQVQFNEVVLEGAIDPETAQARVSSEGKVFNTLQERLNTNDAYLADNVKGIGLKTPANLSDLSVYFVGDSTSDESLGYDTQNSPTKTMYDRLDQYWLSPGKSLNGATRFTFAKSGQTLLDFLNNVNSGAAINTVINKANEATEKEKLKIIVFSLGHNGNPDNSNYDTRLTEMRTAMNRLLKETDCQIILRMPNNWNISETVSKTLAAERTGFLSRLYKQIASEYPRTKLLDVQAILGKTGAYAQKQWSVGESVTSGNFRFVEDRTESLFGGKVYKATLTGTTGSTAPSGTGNGISDGSVTWDYMGEMNPYMGDHIHMNKLGYEVIADMVGETVSSMFADMKKTRTISSYSSATSYGEVEKQNDIVLNGTVIKQINNKLILDIDFNEAKKKLQPKDIILPKGFKAKSLGITEKVEKPLTWVPSQQYYYGDICTSTDQFGAPVTLECVYTGVSGSSKPSIPVDQRVTYIADGSIVKWKLLARYHYTRLTYFSEVTVPKGTSLNICRTDSYHKNVNSSLVPVNNFLELATIRFYSTWSEADLSFKVIANSDTFITTADIDITLHQSGGWVSGNILDKAVVTVKNATTPGTSLIKNSDVVIVTTALSTGYRESKVYLKNSAGSNRYFSVQGMAIHNKDQEINGSQKPLIELLPYVETDTPNLPSAASGTTNVTGAYNQAIYMGRADGTLVKLTVDNNNVISASIV